MMWGISIISVPLFTNCEISASIPRRRSAAGTPLDTTIKVDLSTAQSLALIDSGKQRDHVVELPCEYSIFVIAPANLLVSLPRSELPDCASRTHPSDDLAM